MTNLERWRFFMKDIKSPDSYINMGFYYMIGAALQRRVWVGSDLMPLFANLYVILVGPAGLGKGLVLKQIIKMLRHHKLRLSTKESETQLSPAELADLQDQLLDMADIRKMEDPLLIPMAPDSTTYEALVREMGKTIRRIDYRKLNPDTGQLETKTYIHKSLCACLEELSSLLRKHTESIVNFMLVAYDCGDYDYVIKHGAPDRLRKTCLSFMAGTTPEFMRETFDDRLLNEGFASRTLFVSEFANRFKRFEIIEFTPDQIAARQTILDHIKKLTRLYGQATFSTEAFQLMKNYFEGGTNEEKMNDSPKLVGYYARKDIHVQKLSMCVHYAEHTDSVIGVESVALALKLLEDIEGRMHLALSFGRNVIDNYGKSILSYLRKRACWVSKAEIIGAFSHELRLAEIDEVLNIRVRTGIILVRAEARGLEYKAVLKNE